MVAKSNEIPSTEYACNGKILRLRTPQIMAVVNLTPDSFYDGGKYGTLRDVLADAECKVAEGAAILDVGAASSRPGAEEIPEAEEWRRLEEALPALRKAFPDVFISVDTWRSGIARRAAEHGADIINDISGGRLDEDMAKMVAGGSLICIAMHMDGTPRSMGGNPPYEDVVETVLSGLHASVLRLEKAGCTKIIVDPGFGFGKSLRNNYQLLKGIPRLLSLGYPLLAGVSRKSMISRVIGTNPVTALNGTTVLNTIALMNGASILRVHDVSEARQAAELVEFYKSA
jgi:dihydropteroate synthase